MDGLKAARKAAKLSQTEVAERIGVAQPTVSGWECGEYCPDLKNIVSLCDLFDVTPNQLLGYEDITPVSEYSDNEVRLIKRVRELVDNKVINWGHVFDVASTADTAFQVLLRYCKLDEQGKEIIIGKIAEQEQMRDKPTKTPVLKSSAG